MGGVRQGIMSVAFTMLIALSASGQEAAKRPPVRGVFLFQGQAVGLLSDRQVREELKLDAEQMKKAIAAEDFAMERHRVFSQEAKKLEQTTPGAGIESMKLGQIAVSEEYKEAIATFLKPEQIKRLRELTIQRYRTQMFRAADIRKELKLTAAQNRKMDEIFDAMQKKQREISRQLSIPERRQAATVQALELNRKVEADLMAVLTDDQKNQWKEMEGLRSTDVPKLRP